MATKLEQALSGGTEKEPVPKDWRMIGFFGPPSMISDLTLVAVGMGTDKSKLLRKIVGDWLLQNDPVEIASEKVKEILQSPNQEMTPKEFKTKVRAFLKQKKVSNDLIEKVLQSI